MSPRRGLPIEDLENAISGIHPHWDQLKNGRIFVTGATGFFGTWILESFFFANEKHQLNAQLVGLSRRPELFKKKWPHLFRANNITLLRGDVRDFEFPEGGFSHVIHGATTPSVTVPSNEMFETIILGTRRTLQFAEQKKVKRFLFVSSGAVYGKQPVDLMQIPETFTGGPDIMNPVSIYGEGKRVGELLCAVAHHQKGIEVAIARCFAFVGPHLPLDAHFAIGNFIRDALRGLAIQVKDGRPFRSYLYASDLVRWLWTILFLGKACRPYNVGSDQAIAVAELAQRVNSLLKGSHANPSSAALEVGPRGFAPRYVPSTRRCQEELFLRQTIPLDLAIRKTADWAKVQA